MKVILISNILGLGKIGKTVVVKDGFAKNFLIPQKAAINYTKKNLEVFEKEREKFETENSNKTEVAIATKNALEKKQIKIITPSSDEGKLYGSIKSSTIAEAINSQINLKNKVTKDNVSIKEPIKETGIYNIPLPLYYDTQTTIKVIIARSKEDATRLLEEEKTKNTKGSSKTEGAETEKGDQ
jgi:large subunit ribosomal protein L9